MTHESQRIGYDGGRPGWSLQGFLRKAMAVVAAAVLLAGAVAVSIVVFVFVLAAMMVVGAYLWWKTRDVRKQMRASSMPDQGNVIEGEVVEKSVRDLDAHDQR